MSDLKTPPIAAKLRASILQQAIEGKLVPQKPNDEPASKLVERIRAERAELIKQKKAKAPKGGESVIWKDDNGSWWERRGKGEAVCIDEEIPFQIPENWVWARINSLCDFGSCVNVEYDDVATGTWNLDLEDLEKDTSRIIQKKRKKAKDKGSTKHAFKKGMILYSKLRPYLNKVTEADEEGVCTSEILPLNFMHMDNAFLVRLLMSPYFLSFVNAHTSGVKMPRLRVDDARLFLVPVPPVEEQHRIATRVGLLTVLLDRLEKLERERDAVNSAFWRNLPRTVLQQAVQGKLVPQDSAEGTGAELVEHIRRERAELVKQKKAKAPKGGESVIRRDSAGHWFETRGKDEAVCIDDEIPFEIPDNWTWARLEILYKFIDYRGKTPNKSLSGIRLVTASNIRQGFIDDTRKEWISPNEFSSRQSRGISNKGDLFFTTEAPMGNCAINIFDICSAGQRVITFQNYSDKYALDNNLYCLFILSPFFQTQLEKNATGTTAKGIKAATLVNLLLPVPPPAEQKRIADRIDEFKSLIGKRFMTVS